MATTLETIRKLTLQASAPGFTETTKAVNDLASATGNLAVVTDTASKKQLSAEAAYRRQTLALVDGAKQAEQLAKATKVANDYYAQGNSTLDEHTKRLALINQKYGEASVGSKAFAAATSATNAQLVALSAGAGPVGTFLSALGVGGIAAAVVLGTLEKAFNAVSDGAHELAQKAQELRQFSEITGLSAAQVQALRSEAGKFGVTSEEAQTAIQNFTARFNQLRLGSGELYKEMVRLSPTITDQMQRTTDAGEALTLFGKALDNVGDVFERNALVKAATGRGGLLATGFLSGLNVDDITQKFVAAGKGLDDGLIKKLPLLEIEIKKTSAQASQILESMWAGPTLAFEKYLADTRLGFAKWLADLQTGAQDLGASLFSRVTGRPIAPGQPGNRAFPDASAFGVGLGEAATFSAPPKPLTPEAQSAEAAKLVSVLGQMATVTQIVTAKQLELNIAQKEMSEATRITDAQKNALIELTREQANGVMAVKAQTDAVKVQAATLGMSAGAAAEYTAVQTKLNEEIRKGAPLNAADEAALRKAAAALGSRTQAAAQDAAQRNADFERETVFLSDLEKQIAAVQRSLHGDDWKSFMNDGLAATMRVTDSLKQMKDAAISFADSLIQGLLQGKTATQSLDASLKSMASSQVTAALKSTDIQSFALHAGIAAASYVGSIFTGKSAADQAAQDAANQAAVAGAQRAFGFSQTAQTAGLDTSTQAGALAAFDAQAQAQRLQEYQAGGQAINALEQSLAAQRLAIINKFAADAAAAEEQRAKGYQDRLFAATNDTSTLAGQLAAFDRDAQQQRADEMKAGGEAINDLEAALGAERLKIVNDYNQQIIDAQKAAYQQILDYVKGLTTGALSVLSPADQLASAQASFSQQLAQAQAGDVTALQGITATAQTLLQLARDFYGPSVNFGTLYSNVTGSLTALAGGNLGGIVGSYAYGGVVGNGQFGVDSVLARYRGGGSIYLSGGEFVTQARSVTPSTLPTLQQINRTGSANDNDAIADLTRQVQALVMQNSAQVRLLAEANAHAQQNGQRLDGLRADARQATGSSNLRASSKKAS